MASRGVLTCSISAMTKAAVVTNLTVAQVLMAHASLEDPRPIDFPTLSATTPTPSTSPRAPSQNRLPGMGVAPYRDGSRAGWHKVKHRSWYEREAWRFDRR